MIAHTSFEKADLVLPSQLPPNDHTSNIVLLSIWLSAAELADKWCMDRVEACFHSCQKSWEALLPVVCQPCQYWTSGHCEEKELSHVWQEIRHLTTTRGFLHTKWCKWFLKRYEHSFRMSQALWYGQPPLWMLLQVSILSVWREQNSSPALLFRDYESKKQTHIVSQDESQQCANGCNQTCNMWILCNPSSHPKGHRKLHSGQVIRKRDCTKLVSCVCTTCHPISICGNWCR